MTSTTARQPVLNTTIPSLISKHRYTVFESSQALIRNFPVLASESSHRFPGPCQQPFSKRIAARISSPFNCRRRPQRPVRQPSQTQDAMAGFMVTGFDAKAQEKVRRHNLDKKLSALKLRSVERYVCASSRRQTQLRPVRSHQPCGRFLSFFWRHFVP